MSAVQVIIPSILMHLLMLLHVSTFQVSMISANSNVESCMIIEELIGFFNRLLLILNNVFLLVIVNVERHS